MKMMCRGKALIAGGNGGQSNGFAVTLPAADWNGLTQTVHHEQFLANSKYWYFLYCDSGIEAEDITVDGQAVFKCKSVPETDTIVHIIRLEAAT